VSKNIPRIGFILIFAILATIWLYFPYLISSKNIILNSFFDNQLLGILGFVISVTIASCLQIYFRLLELEEMGRGPFQKTKQALRRSCFSLICLFAASFVCLTLKGMHFSSSDRYIAFFNAIFILQFYFFVSVLLDVARASFRIP
jgi:hypothetical protein